MLRFSENRALRTVFALEKQKVTGKLRRLHNLQFYDLYFSPKIIREIKSRIIRWAGHVTTIGERGGAYRVLVGDT